MTCGQGADDTKLRAIIHIVSIDSVAVTLGLDLERVRAMRDGRADIDPESAALIHREVDRLKGAGIWAEEAETLEPEVIGSNDATAVVAETTVPEAGPQDVEGPREAVGQIAEGVLALAVIKQGEAYSGFGERMSEYEQALFDIVRFRLHLALNFRRPLSTGRDMAAESAVSRRDFIRSLKSDLRNAETRLKKSRGLFNFLRKLPDPSGNELYRELVIEWCEKTGADSERALALGLEGVGKFLYPDMSAESTTRVQRLGGRNRLAAEAILEAVLLAEEVEFRSPLPCEAKLAALEIKSRMEFMLILELRMAPPSFDAYPGPLHYANGPEAQRVRRRILETLGREFKFLNDQKRACKQYKGWESTEAFFHQLIDASGAEECRPLTRMIGLDIESVYGSPFFRTEPIGFFNHLYGQPGPDH